MSAELATPAAKAAKDEANSSKIVPVDLPYGDKARWLFRTTFVQVSIACVILFNFGAIVVEKEIDPCSDASMQKMPELWAAIDDVCNVIFLLELILNLYGHWWRPFLQSGWNYLDTVVVIIGVIGLMRIDLGDFKRIKIIRAFRILRLFKRVESLNQILSALIRSIPGVLNAFIVMVRRSPRQPCIRASVPARWRRNVQRQRARRRRSELLLSSSAFARALLSSRPRLHACKGSVGAHSLTQLPTPCRHPCVRSSSS